MVESFIESELGPSLMTPEALAKSINDAEAAKMEGTIGESGHGNTQGVEDGADSNLQGEGGEAADSAYGDTVETDLNTGTQEYGTTAQAPGNTYAPAYAVPAMIGPNEHVTVAGIENVGDNPTVRLADGRSVPMGQVTFGNYGTQAIYETAGEFEQSANANRFLQVYQNSGMEAADFLQLYLNVYQEEIQNQRVLGDRTQTGLSEYMPSGLPPHMNRLLGQAGVPIQGNQRNQAGQGQRPAVLRDKPFALQDVALPGTLNLSNGTLGTINALRAGDGLPPMEWGEGEQQNVDVAETNQSGIMGTEDAQANDGSSEGNAVDETPNVIHFESAPVVTEIKYKPTSGVVFKANPSKTTTILGSYEQDMKHILNEMGNVKSTYFGEKKGGFNVLNVPNEIFKTRTRQQFWDEINKPWLDEAIKRGDDIVLATRPEGKVMQSFNKLTGEWGLSGFAREYQYLCGKGYHYDPVTNMMMK